ncbi:MAG: class I SAM-dependent methyltransferase [Bdellovibrionota bacterium]
MSVDNTEVKPPLHVVDGKGAEGTGVEGVGVENEIYTKRFTSEQEATRKKTWEVLCRDFFQSYVTPNDVVVDIGAGDGYFLKNIKARRKIAVDLSPHVNELSRFGVEVLQIPASELSARLSEKADIVFMSNFLEHLPNKQLLLEILAECRKALKPGGMVLILQPNIRYVGSAYWDYIDHHIALTEHSLSEALEVSGFEIVRLVPRFLPYTAKSGIGALAGLSSSAWMIETYLKFPLLWRFFGQQTFVVAASK